MMRVRLIRLLALAAAALGSGVAAGEARSDALVEARECGRLESEARRLSCYDALFRGSDATTVRTETATPTAEFGLSAVARERRQAEAGAPSPAQITSLVVALEDEQHGMATLVLENGQRWRMLEATAFIAFRVGDTVTIRRAALGSFLASAAGRKAAWRVRRLA